MLWHPKHKTNQDEWSRAVLDGKLTGAMQALKRSKRCGPFMVLCDGESFLRARKSMQAYRRKNVSLWICPPMSPDLNPVEMFWGWLRKKMRNMDLTDMRKRRPPLGKAAYVLRIKSVVQSNKAQDAAKVFARKLRSTCKLVCERQGAAADN